MQIEEAVHLCRACKFTFTVDDIHKTYGSFPADGDVLCVRCAKPELRLSSRIRGEVTRILYQEKR